ncbi:MAG: DUF131 domain-containing protein [Desulfurococcaceae archaeon]|nr:DUF131 domain-containing protein [Desulfurococcaceae archaeon]
MSPLVLMFTLMLIGVLLIIVGFALIFLSTITKESREESRVEAGGVLVIGPVPIVIGTSQRIAKAVLILALALFIVAIVFFVLTQWFKVSG